MFDFVRNYRRLMLLLLLLLIFPSFVFFGLQSYKTLSEETSDVAKVAGQPIRQIEFDNAVRQQTQRLQEQMGKNYDAKILDTPEAKAGILDGLVSERLMQREVETKHLHVSNAAVQTAIGEIPAVKALFGSDGKFSVEQYDLLLSAQNLTRDQFFAQVRNSLLIQQVVDPIQTSTIVPATLVNRLANLIDQRREVAELLIKRSDYIAQAKVTPDAVQKYYDANQKKYEIPERVKLEYLVLSSDALAASVSVTPEAIQEYYNNNKNRYQVAEQRRASHILIAAPADAKSEDREKAKAKAEAILKKVKANPADFAKLAKENSEDPGSAANGGDLDYLGKGATVPPFEKALFALQENQISDLVQSDFGYHIIQLTGIKPAVIKPLETVRAEIDAELRKQMVAKKFSESADGFTNTVYEQADSLEPAANKYGLKIQTAENVTRVPPLNSSATLPFNNAKVLAAVFTDDVLKKKHNTPAVEIGTNTLVAARAVEYQPTRLRPLAEVTESIKADLLKQEVDQLIRKDGEVKLAELQSKSQAENTSFGPVKWVGRAATPEVDPVAVDALFKADVSKLPAYVGVTLSSGDYAIYRISRFGVVQIATDSEKAQLTETMARQFAELERASYLASLKKNAKVKYFGNFTEIMNKKPKAG